MDPNILRLLGMTGTVPAPINPNIMTAPSPTSDPSQALAASVDKAAATLAAGGAQPPATTPVAGKPPTALPDRNGSPQPMLPMTGGEMDSYYNDTPDPTQPLTAAGVQTPTQKALSGLASGLQDVQVPKTETPRPPSPVSPPGPTVRPDMSALMQMITAAGQRPQDDPRKAGLAAMLMRG